MTTTPVYELPRHASTLPLVWGAISLVFLVLIALLSALRNQKPRS